VVISLSRFLRFASAFACLIVLVWFLVFAIDQTREASGHQREQVAGTDTQLTTSTAHEGAARSVLDEVGRGLTAPFSGVVSETRSEWLARGVRVLLALLVYGFGLGFLARFIRVRV
jgi:hypothetical protein